MVMPRLLALLALAAPLQAQAPDSVIRLLERATLPAIRIAGEPAGGAPLAERMAHYRTPAVSVAVMDSGKIVWTKAWGMADKEPSRNGLAGLGSRDALEQLLEHQTGGEYRLPRLQRVLEELHLWALGAGRRGARRATRRWCRRTGSPA